MGKLESLSDTGCFGELDSGGVPSMPQGKVRKDPGIAFLPAHYSQTSSSHWPRLMGSCWAGSLGSVV